ncbi:Retrovirus-related Pol polyprotein from transposon TNT 1-94 [Sarcoptes scabiei]|uniref:Retrovirus-related Pol polyprotein from transposon TNT 1-94 n=2 Tax=Sarcoptes scabiei TaxID=52283 RepID=A0A834RIC2_SARSC|nr:Retrovirus-related Pol polyprotein from transposon TNT 1-94 [Sarcoptes scabiei]
MSKEKRVFGVPDNLKSDIGFCSSCEMGKMTEVPHYSESEKDVPPGAKIHLDIGGYTMTSIHSNKYYLIAEDHSSRYVKILFMKSREEVLDKFKMIINEIELETNRKVLCIRTDMGTEFNSNAFQDFIKSRGIIHEKATVATPQQNGRCERVIRTLTEHARSMLSAANMPLFLWDEAMNCSVYLYNRMLNSHDFIPYEKYLGSKPDVSNLIIFGSNGEMLNKDREDKFSPKTISVKMVGYHGDSIYRVFLPHRRKILLTSSVKFDEKPKCQKSDIPQINLLKFINEQMEQYSKWQSGGAIKSDDSFKSEDSFMSDDYVEPELRNSDEDHSVERRIGRPQGSKNKKYEQSIERVQSLRSHTPKNVILLSVVPTNYVDAIKGEDAHKWKEAMNIEYDQLIKYDTWDLVERPPNNEVVSVKWVYTIKSNGRYKARLVARGFEQSSFDLDVYSPVIQMDSIRLFFSIVASKRMELIQFDCSNAFLNGEINETVYINQAPGFEDGTNRVCLLKKGIYGLRQSPKSWNRKFDEVIQRMGFIPTKLDPCLYSRKHDGKFTLLCLYVDDALVASNSQDECVKIVNEIGRNFEIQIDCSNRYVGIQYEYNRELGKIKLSQQKYIEEKLKLFKMDQCKAAATPIASGMNPYEESLPNDEYPYKEAIGALLILSCKTRPDITFAVSLLSRFMDRPCQIHVWRYLKGSIERGIVLGWSDTSIVSFSDADLAGDKDARLQLFWINQIMTKIF